jgi:hypothetical protein
MTTQAPVQAPNRRAAAPRAADSGDLSPPAASGESPRKESPACWSPVEYSGPAEDDFWKANHQSQTYAGETSYGFFAPAYRAGYEGYARHGVAGRTFEEVEPQLRRDYEHNGGKLEWTAARLGAQAAWNRLARRQSVSVASTRDSTIL